MTDDVFADRRRANEEDYFRKRDKELIEKMRLADGSAAAERMSEPVDAAEDALLRRLAPFGFSEDTLTLLHVIPLVQVAWHETVITDAVAHRIVERARGHGIEPSSDADRQLATLLGTRPPDALFDEALSAIRTLLQQHPPIEREWYIRELLEDCTAVAAASGGVFGFAKVSSTERATLNRIRDVLESIPSQALGQ